MINLQKRLLSYKKIHYTYDENVFFSWKAVMTTDHYCIWFEDMFNIFKHKYGEKVTLCNVLKEKQH